MIERLEAIKEKYEELSKELTNPEVLNDYNKLKKLSKEQKDLEETYNKYNEYKNVLSNIEEAKELVDDPEMGEMAKLEKEELTAKKESLVKELEILLIPKDENDPWEKCKSCEFFDEFFDGDDICTHKKNFGSVTEESEKRCNLLKLWRRKQ